MGAVARLTPMAVKLNGEIAAVKPCIISGNSRNVAKRTETYLQRAVDNAIPGCRRMKLGLLRTKIFGSSSRIETVSE